MKDEENRYKQLGNFLRSKRAKIMPEQVGIKQIGSRRTPGLRREEVAQLAGVGLTWYTWLEQGRAIHVSAQVLESLARVLGLDQGEKLYLYHLANQPVPQELTSNIEKISPIMQHMIDSLTYSPTIITDYRWNVVGFNKAACKVLGDLDKLQGYERNIVWCMFMLPMYKSLIIDWEKHAKDILGKFRSTCGKYSEDAWLMALVKKLKEESEDFRSLWASYTVEIKSEVHKRLNHPRQGILEFEVSYFEVAENDSLKMIVHTPMIGTVTKEKMKKLVEEIE